jgi:hypothetical protein
LPRKVINGPATVGGDQVAPGAADGSAADGWAP